MIVAMQVQINMRLAINVLIMGLQHASGHAGTD
jgi:hypothetical protein